VAVNEQRTSVCISLTSAVLRRHSSINIAGEKMEQECLARLLVARHVSRWWKAGRAGLEKEFQTLVDRTAIKGQTHTEDS